MAPPANGTRGINSYNVARLWRLVKNAAVIPDAPQARSGIQPYGGLLLFWIPGSPLRGAPE
jgi:hypothetical protein